MASRRLVPLVAAFLILAGSYSLLIWLSNHYFLVRSQEEQPPPAVASRLADFQWKHGRQGRDFTDSHHVDHVICGGCYHAVAKPDENIRCGFLIHNLMNEDAGLDLIRAAQTIATSGDYREACARCHPEACSARDKVYWRYDANDQLPTIGSSSVPNLASIPSSQKIPAHAVANLTAFFSRANIGVPATHYLFDYNPSIVILPTSLLDDATTRMFLGKNGDVPVYVASFRVSTQQSCFHPYETQAMYGGSWDKKPPVQDYLALAFLRADLSILQDVVVDIKTSGVFQQFAEDFRLFVLGGQLHVASYDLIAPLRITATGPSSRIDQDGYVLLESVYPSTLAVAMRQFPSCPVCHNRPNKRCGKNLNYFSATDTDSVTLVELWPSGPHVVQQVNLQQPCHIARETGDGSTSTELQTFSDAGSSHSQPSWHTMEEVMFPNMEPSETILTRGRGGACCISIHHPQTGEQLLVGIEHLKIPKLGKRSGKRLPVLRRVDGGTTAVAPNQYLSRWYAFQQTQPFQIVAQSGLFCLGYPGPLEQSTHPLVKTTIWKKMIFGGDGKVDTGNYSLSLECPRIHFVSGISEKAGDPSKVIVSYGINDCFSRLIELEKASIVKAMFPLVSSI